MSQDEDISRDKSEVPQSNNAFLLRHAITKNFECIAVSVSKEEFLEILTIVKEKPSIGRKLHKAMINELLDGMNDELEGIYQEGSLTAGLTELSKLSEEKDTVNNDEVAWRPPGDVKLHLRSLDAEKIKAESEKLEKWVTEMENENGALIKQLADARAKVRATSDRIAKNLHRAPMVQERLENQVEQLQRLLEALEED
ncbi:hypothetical protein KPH14_005418 [Odynerus spinipes]|uniref:Polyamine-modulated factor 1 n=1 Tax=Odynerus spinipes TaxID=1348599 RepID=A0AAD9RBW4_9HYME|nr:hypothetical protein KPH14_005418 [Odynerus spinipes]